MRPAVEGGGGPFAYYPVTGDAIREVASEADGQASQLDAVRRQLDGGHRQLMGAVEGDIEAPLAGAPDAARASADRVAQVARFAAGVLRLFADAVEQFNRTSTRPRSVAKLNEAYAEARLSHFGLANTEHSPADWQEARAAVVGPSGTLTVEYARLEEQLDIWADHAARMLDRGPNPVDVRELWMTGALPPDAALLWPDLRLNATPVLRLPYELRDEVDDGSLDELSDDELRHLWDEHGYRPARELLSDRVADDVQSRTALTEFNLRMNPYYWKALSEGFSEDMARQLANVNPASFADILTPYVIAGRIAYGVAARDLVETLEDDPWSLRTLGELAMVGPIGGVGKLTKLDNAVDAIDDARDATRGIDATDSVVEGSRTVSGRFPRTAEDGDILVRRSSDGRVTHYQVYGSDGLPLKRVDVTGRPHGGVDTPHVVEFERDVNPTTGETFVRPSKEARRATPEELKGLE